VINSQCDSLVNEIETKREFFLSDLEYEEKSKHECLMQHIEGLRQQGTSLQNLVQFANAILRESDPCAFIQVHNHLVLLSRSSCFAALLLLYCTDNKSGYREKNLPLYAGWRHIRH
jgi:hypothetical protein